MMTNKKIGFLQEFKAFAMRGNVIDLAIAVVMGAAFGKIVSSLVEGIVMPLIGLLLGGVDIASKSLKIGQAVVKWGLLLQNILDFAIIAFAIFLAVKLIALLQREKAEEVHKKSSEEILLTEIRDLLKNNLEH